MSSETTLACAARPYRGGPADDDRKPAEWLRIELQDPDCVAFGVLEPRGRPTANIGDAVDRLQPREVVLLEYNATGPQLRNRRPGIGHAQTHLRVAASVGIRCRVDAERGVAEREEGSALPRFARNRPDFRGVELGCPRHVYGRQGRVSRRTFKHWCPPSADWESHNTAVRRPPSGVGAASVARCPGGGERNATHARTHLSTPVPTSCGRTSSNSAGRTATNRASARIRCQPSQGTFRDVWPEWRRGSVFASARTPQRAQSAFLLHPALNDGTL